MMPEDVARICKAFALGRPQQMEFAGGTRNRNYAVTTNCGRWMLRRCWPDYASEERLAFDASAAEFLSARGVAVRAPRACGDRRWLRDGGYAWQAQPFIEGRHLWDGCEQDLRALGEALGRWHTAGRDFALRFMKAAPRAEAEPDLILSVADRVAAESPDAGPALARYRSAVMKAAVQLPDADYIALPHTLIHGDVQPANILIRNEAVVGMVDLDWCCWQARLYDVCNAILFCCAGHAEPLDGSDIASITQAPILDPAVVAGFLHSYQKAAGALTAAERLALKPLCMLTWCHTRINGALKTPASARRAFLERPPDVTTSDWLNLPLPT